MKISKAKHQSCLVCAASLHFVQGVTGQGASKITLIFSSLWCLGFCPREKLHLFVEKLLSFKSKACSPFCSMRFRELDGLWSSTVCRDLRGAQNGEGAKTQCKLRLLTQTCEDSALVSLNYSSPLAEHAP